MNELAVDRQKCVKCGTCVSVCPAEVIEFGEDGFPRFGERRAGRCIACGQCVVFCPKSADMLSFMDEKNVVESSDIDMPSALEAENFLKTRRSVRKFKKDAVPKEMFDKIFDAVSQAPTAVNLRAVRWVVTETPEKTKEITNLILCWFREEIFKNPTGAAALLGAGMIARAKKGVDALLRGAPNVAVAVAPKDHRWYEDGVIALTYFELAAHALGLGCCWGGYLTVAIRNFAPLREFLKIKEDEHICGAQMIGYPALLPRRQYPPRKKPEIYWL